MPALRLMLPLVLATLIGGCAPFRSTISTGPDGLRTFTPRTAVNGQRILCHASAAIDPLVGRLRGQEGEQEPVWLVTADDRAVSVVWPAGFRLQFEPDATLYNDHGERVAVDGDEVALWQVSTTSHTGSYADPFIASGIVYDGCYVYLP